MMWAGHEARMRQINAYKIIVGKPKWKKPFGIPKLRPNWEDNIKLDHKFDWRLWIGLIWLRIGIIGRLL
jgi:hypothetical protein